MASLLEKYRLNGRNALVRPGEIGGDLVVVAHAGKSDPEEAAATMPFHLVDPRATVAFLTGSPDFLWFAKNWSVGNGLTGWAANLVRPDDTAHVHAVRIELELLFKTRRTLLAGHSNGAMLMLLYAAIYGQLPGFDVVTFAGTLTEIPKRGWAADPRLRIRDYHGTNDRLVPMDGPIRVEGKRLPDYFETKAYFGRAFELKEHTSGHYVPDGAATEAMEWFKQAA